MISCSNLIKLLKEEPIKLEEAKIEKVFQMCISKVDKYPKKEMFKRLLNCSDQHPNLIVEGVHSELERAELSNDLTKLLELKNNYRDFCDFHISKYPYYKWYNYNSLD